MPDEIVSEEKLAGLSHLNAQRHDVLRPAPWLLWVASRFDHDQAMQEVFQSEDLTYTRTDEGWVIQAIEPTAERC